MSTRAQHVIDCLFAFTKALPEDLWSNTALSTGRLRNFLRVYPPRSGILTRYLLHNSGFHDGEVDLALQHNILSEDPHRPGILHVNVRQLGGH